MSMKTKVLRSLVFYSIETSVALIGWTYGFGLEVKNWPVLLGTLFFVRWLFYILQSIWYLQDARAQALKELEQRSGMEGKAN